MRARILFLVVAGALAALWWKRTVAPSPELVALSYVTTARQLGVVGYRDPAGAISPDGKRFAYSEGRFIRIVPIGGGPPVTLPPSNGQVRNLQWTSNETVAAVPRPPVSFRMADGVDACVADRRIVFPCGGKHLSLDPDVDVVGPIAFTERSVYFASPAEHGMVALWTADLATRKARRLTWFSRDTYGPSVGGGTVVFKTQTYRTFLADVPAGGGPTRQLTTFQSETPSYHPMQPLMAFTFGTWRRQLDDGRYPDIAQDIGTIDLSKPLPADVPASVIAKSESEDQAMTWSPNGKWIAFHSHRNMSDDVWLRPADGSAADRRITFLGRGAEVGWPRWSPDGRLVLLDGARKTDGQSVVYVIGVDQDSGAVTSEQREVLAEGFTGEITHAEWLGSDAVVALAKEGPGRQALISLSLTGGMPRIIHRFRSEHDFAGLGISTDTKTLAFTGLAADGYYQIFTKGAGGDAPPIQLTSDPSNKTQPTFSPDGSRVAFTVWSYEAAFWSFSAR